MRFLISALSNATAIKMKISAEATACIAFSGIFQRAVTSAEWKLSPAKS